VPHSPMGNASRRGNDRGEFKLTITITPSSNQKAVFWISGESVALGHVIFVGRDQWVWGRVVWRVFPACTHRKRMTAAERRE